MTITDTDPTTLLATVGRLSGRAMEPGLDNSEQIMRTRAAANASRDLVALLADLDPYPGYRPREGAGLVADLCRAHRRSAATEAERDDARRRYERHQTAQRLHARANQTTTDTPGLLTPLLVGVGDTAGLPGSPLLDALAVAVDFFYAGMRVPTGWVGPDGNPPAAVLDAVEKTSVFPANGAASVEEDTVAWHTSAYALNVARQVLDWGQDAQAALDLLFARTVDLGLESAIVADLLTMAGTPIDATTNPGDALDTAEATASTLAPASHLVVNPADWPKLRRGYTSNAMWPPPLTVVRTSGCPAGTALVLASGGVFIGRTDLVWQSLNEPAVFGYEVASVRYGAVAPYQASPAVAALDLTPAVP